MSKCVETASVLPLGAPHQGVPVLASGYDVPAVKFDRSDLTVMSCQHLKDTFGVLFWRDYLKHLPHKCDVNFIQKMFINQLL